MEQPLLEMRDLEVCYGEKTAAADVNLRVWHGEILGIVGESGCGKTTLMKTVMGILGADGRITKGSVLYQGEDMTRMSREKLRAQRGAEIGMIFQNTGASLCPVRTIEAQIYESVRAHERSSREEIRKRALGLLETMCFEDGERILKSYPFELSGGMNQRIGILLAMLLRPKLILADEATSALDVTAQLQVLNEMGRMREMYGTAFVIVTHNIRIVERMADCVAVMKQGHIIEYGKKEAVINHPKEAYTKQLLSSVLRLKREEERGGNSGNTAIKKDILQREKGIYRG